MTECSNLLAALFHVTVSCWQVEENTRENHSSVDIQGGECSNLPAALFHVTVSSWKVEENTRENQSSVDIQGGE